MAEDDFTATEDRRLYPDRDTRQKRLEHLTPSDTSSTGGLPKVTELCLGCRIMLRKNINVTDGLVNGAQGTVVGFSMAGDRTYPESCSIRAVFVSFDDKKVGMQTARKSLYRMPNNDSVVPIERNTSHFFGKNRKTEITRQQFPLVLCWGATIHRVQGLTMDKAVVGLRSVDKNNHARAMQYGQAYVALSRVRSLTGLHILEFEKSSIRASPAVNAEMQRLRAKSDINTQPVAHIASANTDDNTCQYMPKKQQRKRKNSDIIDVTANNKRARANAPPTTSDSTDIALTGYNECSIYHHCQIASIDAEFQLQTCERLNLRHFEPTNNRTTACTPKQAENGVASLLQEAIFKQTGNKAHVIKYSIVGDGNCLFRALSQAVTGSQDQHLLCRSSIVNHMLDNTVKNSMEQLFHHRTHHDKNYLINMAKPGVWGTEQEIAAAAHLFDCSIVCLSKYSNTQFCLQHFPPHFISSAQCTSTCNHNTIYLINSSGTHYESAVVTTTETQDEE